MVAIFIPGYRLETENVDARPDKLGVDAGNVRGSIM